MSIVPEPCFFALPGRAVRYRGEPTDAERRRRPSRRRRLSGAVRPGSGSPHVCWSLFKMGLLGGGAIVSPVTGRKPRGEFGSLTCFDLRPGGLPDDPLTDAKR